MSRSEPSIIEQRPYKKEEAIQLQHYCLSAFKSGANPKPGNQAKASLIDWAKHQERALVADSKLTALFSFVLRLAASEGNEKTVSHLITLNPSLISQAGSNGTTAVFLAAHFGHSKVLKLLLDNCPEESRLQTISRQATNRLTPLDAALKRGHYYCAVLLLQAGADESVAIANCGFKRFLTQKVKPTSSGLFKTSNQSLVDLYTRLFVTNKTDVPLTTFCK